LPGKHFTKAVQTNVAQVISRHEGDVVE